MSVSSFKFASIFMNIKKLMFVIKLLYLLAVAT